MAEFQGSTSPPPELARLSPAGTVPILETETGTLIRSSIAIIEYLEERFPSPNMLGETPEARALTRELVSVIDEAATQFGIWCRKASPLFAEREQQSREAATFAADAYHGRLRVLDAMIQERRGLFWQERRSQALIASPWRHCSLPSMSTGYRCRVAAAR